MGQAQPHWANSSGIYDVQLSGGISPNVFLAPVTRTYSLGGGGGGCSVGGLQAIFIVTNGTGGCPLTSIPVNENPLSAPSPPSFADMLCALCCSFVPVDWHIISNALGDANGSRYFGFPSLKNVQTFIPARMKAVLGTDNRLLGPDPKAQFEARKLWGDLGGPSVVFSSK